MSYRQDEGYEPETAKRSYWYWPALDTLDDSYSVARKSFGGWVFAGMIALGGVVTYFSGKSAVDLQTPATDMAAALLGTTVELLFVLFASYRIMIGRGWIISWFLVAAFLAEAVIKVLGGHSFGWIIFYIAIGSSILAGARACWDIRSRLKSGETRRSTDELQTVFD
jgi:hypothetical protein